MTTRKRALAVAACSVTAALMASAASADVASDRAAAILVFPKVIYNTSSSVDTVIQITNTSNQLTRLHCFYINANSHCSISQTVCDLNEPGSVCPNTADVCIPGWNETDFDVILTQQQPIAWEVGNGLDNQSIPLDGFNRTGPNGQTNLGTRVPPVPAEPLELGVDPRVGFVGEMRCIVVDESGRGVPRNVIKGEATLVSEPAGAYLDVEKYNGVGIQAINGDVDGNGFLILGGDAGEYNGCAGSLIVDHFFDFAENPVTGDAIFSDLTLVPCQSDLLNQVPGGGTAQFLVYNEYEQRFSTSTPIQCFFERQLSRIDTRNTHRSVFSSFVAGTLVGQTRVRGINTGLIGVLRERHGADFIGEVGSVTDSRTAAFNVHMQGDRQQPDQIVLPDHE